MNIYQMLERQRETEKAKMINSVLCGGRGVDLTREKTFQLRALIEEGSQALPDERALQGVELFPTWSGDSVNYKSGDRYQFDGILYRCLQDHVSQSGWTPTAAPSLWARVLIPDPTQIPDWEQPDSTNPYAKGDKVRHNGKVWVSTIDGNVWEPGAPGVYVWTEVQE